MGGLQDAPPEEEAGFFTIGRRFFRRDGQEEDTVEESMFRRVTTHGTAPGVQQHASLWNCTYMLDARAIPPGPAAVYDMRAV